MSRLYFLITLILFLSLTSCEKDNETDSIDFLFEATVISKGLDCGETFVLSLTNRSSNSDFVDGMYYADHLDSEFKVSGLEIYLNCREPNETESYPCTALGPSYPHVIVTDVKKRD